MAGKRIFVSYKRNTEFDQPLANRLVGALQGAGHSVFIDQGMHVGEDWVRRIKSEVEAADFLILLVSELSVQSQMVVEEVRMARAQLERSRDVQPRILPVRVAFDGELPYDLGAWLNRLNYASWQSAADDQPLTAALLAAIGAGATLPGQGGGGAALDPAIPLPSANPRLQHALEAPEGTMQPSSPFYVARSADAIVADELKHESYTLTIQAARQMGKSSLLGRVMADAQAKGRRVAFIDFQGFGHQALSQPETLYHQFSFLIDDALDLDSDLETLWKVPLSPSQKCRRYIEKRVLPACAEKGLLLALDEADALLDVATANDFFGMLRSWHNERAVKPAWRKLSLAMVISTEPYLLINNPAQSPFNVGAVVMPEDFDLAQTGQVHAAHGGPLSATELKQLHELLAGHPFLVRKALYLVSRTRMTGCELLADAASETGPFGDHLRALLARLHQRPELLDGLRAALNDKEVPAGLRHRLIAGGLVRESGGRLAARNPLYDSYFRRVL